jgi:glutamate-1-semialdehyde 2,1-aminomutase
MAESQVVTVRGSASGVINEAPAIPGGVGRSSLAVGGAVRRATGGYGCHLVDDAGQTLLDLNNNFTTLVHGHGHPAILEAAVRALSDGVCFGMPNALELEHAELLVARFPHADQVVYANSGTEAVMLALRVARARTRKAKVLLVANAYHGTGDAALAGVGLGIEHGVPASAQADVVAVPHNDLAALRAAFREHAPTLAAVLLDLLPNRAGLVPLSPEFVASAAELAARHGIPLIVDEVISFRLDHAGHQSRYQLVPDLTILGKGIGGGFPVGAVVGSEDLMSSLNPEVSDSVEHGGTFSGNPVTMAAGIASLRLLDAPAIASLNALGARVRTALEPVARARGWEVRGIGSLLRLMPGPGLGDPLALARALWWAAYGRGILLMPTGMLALSTPMDGSVVEEIAGSLDDALAEISGEL